MLDAVHKNLQIGQRKVVAPNRTLQRIGRRSFRQVVKAFPEYRPDGNGGFLPIKTNIKPNIDGHVGTVDESLFRFDADNDGTFTVEHRGARISFRPVAVVGFDEDGNDYTPLLPIQSVTPKIDGNTITWTDIFAGVECKIKVLNDRVKETLEFSEGVRELLQNSGRIYAGVLYEASIEKGGHDLAATGSEGEQAVDEEFETEGAVLFRDAGRLKHTIEAPDFTVESRPCQPIPCKMKWFKKGATKYLLVGCLTQSLKDRIPGKLILDPTVTFQEGVSGYSGCTDTHIRKSLPTYNNGSCGYSRLGTGGSGDTNRIPIRFDCSSIPAGATINSSHLYLLCDSQDTTNPEPTECYRIKRAWGEGVRCGATAVSGECSWNDAKAGVDSWQTAGCAGANDRESSPTDTQNVGGPVVPVWTSWDVTADVQYFVNGNPNEGWLLKFTAAREAVLYQKKYPNMSEDPTPAERPYLVTDYTPPGPQNWYVDGVGGLDTNGGTGWGDAFKTLGKANTKVVDTDTVFVKAAVYNEQLTLAHDVTWDATQENVILDGTSLSGHGFEITGAAHLPVINGFLVQNFSSGAGFYVTGAASVMELRDCVSWGNQYGGYGYNGGTLLTKFDCEFRASSSHGLYISGSGAILDNQGTLKSFLNGGQGIFAETAAELKGMDGVEIWTNSNGIKFGTGYPTVDGGILNSAIYNNTNDGIVMDEEVSGLLIASNDIYSNGQDGIHAGESALTVDDIRMRRNKIYNNGRDGIRVHSSSGVDTIRIYRNTLWGNGQYGIYYHPSATTDCFISSSIIASSIDYGIETTSSFLSLLRYNCIKFNKAAVYDGSEHEAGDVGTGNLGLDPVMINPGGSPPDFKLGSTSPCIGAGETEPS